MAKKQRCEFFVLRYVPNVVREEFVNIGLVLRSESGMYTDVRFRRDWERVRAFDPEADIKMLQAVTEEIARCITGASVEREHMMHMIQDSLGNALQLSPIRNCITESPEAEIARLTHIYLGPTAELRRFPRYSVKLAIVLRMEREPSVPILRGTAVTIGEGGLGAKIEGKVIPGEVVQLESSDPQLIAPLRARAQVLYHRNDVYGFEFREMSTLDKANVRRLCQRFASA